MDVESQIAEFVKRHLLSRARVHEVVRSESLIGSGLLDSVGIVDLTNFVETTFGIRVDDEEIVPANFESIERLAAFVERKRR